MASRTGAILQSGVGNSLSRRAAGERYTYLPWVDCICAGVPCQDVSVAGKRAGLKGKRTRLVYHFARILRELRPTWFVFENVPGLLSSNDGRDFAEVLRLFMVRCGYGISWRVLDSQFFGVAQRRSRLFIVGYFGKPCPAEILFEPEGVQGSAAPGREKRQNIAVPITSGTGLCGKPAGRRMEDDFNLAVCGTYQNTGPGWWNESDTAATLRTPDGGDSLKSNLVAAPITASYGKQPDSSDCNGGPPNLVLGRVADDGHSRLLNAGEAADDARETAFCLRSNRGNTSQGPDNLAIVGTLDASDGGYNASRAAAGHYIASSPPDSHGMRDFTGLPKGMDFPRYRALGNAVTKTVSLWIAERIVAYEK